jgi:hypothetical protein
MSKFLPFLFWVHELMAFCFTGKEPSHDGLRLRLSTIRERDRNLGASPIAHSRNRIERRNQSPIFAENLDQVTIVGVG